MATLRAENWNLDQKNPHAAEAKNHDPDVLLREYKELRSETQEIRERLKTKLADSFEARP